MEFIGRNLVSSQVPIARIVVARIAKSQSQNLSLMILMKKTKQNKEKLL
jgi:hypothetical protein